MRNQIPAMPDCPVEGNLADCDDLARMAGGPARKLRPALTNIATQEVAE